MATRKVCLPKAKIASMSQAERNKVINAKESAADQGKKRRSSKSNIKGVRPKGATLRDWFKKENWTNVKTGKPCGAPSMTLEKVKKQLEGAVIAHGKQADAIGKHLEETKDGPSMESPLNKKLKFGRKKKKKQVRLSVGRGEKLSVKRGSGLTAKGRRKYNKATGGNLKAPVTGKVKPGSKAAKRRKSFCARSRGWKGPRGIAARKRWKC